MAGLFFPETDAYVPGGGSLVRPNFEMDGVKYVVLPPSLLYARLALRPQNAAQLPPVYALDVNARGKENQRLILRFRGRSAGEALLEREISQILLQFSTLLHEDASPRARNAVAHFFHDGYTTLAIWPDIFVDEPFKLLNWIGTWLSKQDGDISSDPVESCASIDEQPCSLERYQLPLTGGLRYFISGTCDGHLRRITDEALSALIRDQCAYVEDERRRPGEHHARLVIKRNLKSGVKLSPRFQAMVRRMVAGHGPRGNNFDEITRTLEEARSVAEYTHRLETTLAGVIDLSDSAMVWQPGEYATWMKAQVAAIQEDLRDPDTRLTLPRYRLLLNSIFARERHPGCKVWYKVPKRDDEAEGTDLQDTTLQLFLKNHPLSLRLRAPEDPAERGLIIRDGAVRVDRDTDTYDVLEWYLQFGARQVNGLRYWPLHIGESLSDSTHRDWINTFSGFRCQRWMLEYFTQSEGQFEPPLRAIHRAQQNDPRSDLNFYLRHLKNLLCGSDEVVELVLTWFALLCFYPRWKPDTWLLLVGKPGCGKTSSTTKFSEWMLNKTHTRVVKDMLGLVGHFNADAGNTSLTIIEEMDFKDQKQKALNALQELVTCRDFRLEAKRENAYMTRNFDHFVAHTNVETPIVISTDQRRAMVMVCDHEFNLMLDRPSEREAYLARLARVLDSEDMWKALTFKLWSEFVPSADDAKRKLEWIRTKRTFSPETTRIQLLSMIFYQDKSVLGYLFLNLIRYTPFTTHPGDNFILQPARGVNNREEPFTSWDNWNAIWSNRARRATDCAGFENHSWKRDKNTQRWWHKERKFVVYDNYRDELTKRHAHVLSAVEFWEEINRLLIRKDGEEDVLYGTDISRRDNRTEEWVAFAPYERLRAAVQRAIPTGLGFSWSEWDRVHARPNE